MGIRPILAALLLPAALTATAAASGTTPTRKPVTVGLLETAGPWAEAVAAGARTAAAEINASGGVAGRPLHLAELEPSRPWRDFGSRAARLVSTEDPVALIGPSDGAAAHLAAQIATRFRIPLIALATEWNLTRAWDPWIFRGVPDDEEQARLLLEGVLEDPRGRTVAAVLASGRSGREHRVALERACRGLGAELVTLTSPGEPSGRTADLLLLWPDPGGVDELLRQLEDAQTVVPVVGPHHLDLRVGHTLGYDLVRLIAEAAISAGPEAREIRRYLGEGMPFHGRSGTFLFDHQGNRRGELTVSRLDPSESHDLPFEVHTLMRWKR